METTLDKKKFKRVVKSLIRKGKYNPESPYLFFAEVLNEYVRAGGKINLRKRLFFDYLPAETIFVETLREIGVEVNENIPWGEEKAGYSRRTVVTPILIISAARNEAESVIYPEMVTVH